MLSPETKESIVESLAKQDLTYSEIADKHGRGERTVQRMATANDLNYGQGVRNHWHYSEPSEALAYLLGFYLADGTIGKGYQSGKINSLTLYTTTPELADHVSCCIKGIGFTAHKSVVGNGPRATKTIFHVNVYSSQFARWVNKVCDGKNQIPNLILGASKDIQLAFLSAVIDGDGCVAKRGAIRIRGTCGFMNDMPQLLKGVDIRTGGLHLVSILPSSKRNRELSVRRSDFVEAGGHCYHPSKQHRIEHGKTPYNAEILEETRKRRERNKPICPVCNENTMCKTSDMCRDCYLESDKFHNHLKRIAPMGNKAGNKARWG